MVFFEDSFFPDHLLYTEIFICIFLVGLFTVLNTYLQKWNITLFHESGVCLVLGIIAGYLLYEVFGDTSGFNKGFFFHFMLPLLVFGAGFNMKRKRFFKNIGIIIMLGFGGTIISFLVIGIFTYYWSEQGLLYDHNGKTVYITLQQGLMVGATLSATDVVCTLALVKESKTPRLHSILFGESTSNDAVAIILLTTLQKVDMKDFSTETVLDLVYEFFLICICSVLLGILFGCLCSFITKTFTSLKNWPSRETAIMFYIAWIGYITAEILDMSGIICILVSSIIAGHYSFYNLSENARILTHNFYHFIGDGAEALVFAYLGLTAYSQNFFSLPPLFLTLMFVSALIARILGTFVLSTVIRILTCGRHYLNVKNLSMICVGGIVRGGISFALALTIEGDNSEILQVIILGFVIVGTLFFGTALPVWGRMMNVTETGSMVMDAGGLSVEQENGWFHDKWRKFDDGYLKKWLICEDGLREQREARYNLLEDS